jgi:WD40 repeat protein
MMSYCPLFLLGFFCLIQNNSKAVVGTQTGTLLLFSFNQWADCSDRFPGHPGPVNSMCKEHDSVLYTACHDGVLRKVSILPNALVSNLGALKMPLESVALSHDGRSVATISHDNHLKIWNVNSFVDGNVFDSNDSDSNQEDRKRTRKTKRDFKQSPIDPFFAGLE